MRNFQPALWFSPAIDLSLRLKLMKATVLAESSLYFIFSPGYLHYYDVYRHESGRCHCFPLFLTFYYYYYYYYYYYIVLFSLFFTIFYKNMFLVSAQAI